MKNSHPKFWKIVYKINSQFCECYILGKNKTNAIKTFKMENSNDCKVVSATKIVI